MTADTLISEETLEENARLFAAIGDPARLRILNLICHGGEVCNCQIIPITGYLAPKISRHLACLKQAGLITERREGTFRYYRLRKGSDPLKDELFQLVDSISAGDPLLQEDRTRLDEACSC